MVIDKGKFEHDVKWDGQVYKELERQFKEKKSEVYPEKVIEILQSIFIR